MELIEIVVIAACVIIVGGVIITSLINKKKGKTSCDCDCSKCTGCACSKNIDNKQEGANK